MTDYPAAATPGHASGSTTSELAAMALSATVVSKERRIYDALAEKPRTRWQLVADLGLSYESVNPRVSTMKTRGIIAPTGETKEGPHGLDGDVMKVVAPYRAGQKGDSVGATKQAMRRAINNAVFQLQAGHHKEALATLLLVRTMEDS